ncbi:unnamed protein product [Porites evermanni]|uniref:Uncharacterized protein n=1 Tax=Porites evermanni TaxID=104178 RepID=A0ABN8MST9_9CNID|nr:unnamed protein product [Porites evermanni]
MKTEAVSGEDNFGHYGSIKTINSKFRCTHSHQSTTQWWFGAHILSLSIRRFWGKGEGWNPPSPISNLLSPIPLGRPDTQAIQKAARHVGMDLMSANSFDFENNTRKRGKETNSLFATKNLSKRQAKYVLFREVQSPFAVVVVLIIGLNRGLPKFRRTSFKVNAPVNENSQNWNQYRLS